MFFLVQNINKTSNILWPLFFSFKINALTLHACENTEFTEEQAKWR